MPTYRFLNTETSDEFEEFMKISQLPVYLADNPHIKQLPTFAAFGDSIRMGRQKPDDGFRDILRKVKKNNPRSDVNTF